MVVFGLFLGREGFWGDFWGFWGLFGTQRTQRTQRTKRTKRTKKDKRDKKGKEEEFADVLAWLCTLANINDVDLEKAVEKYTIHGVEGTK